MSGTPASLLERCSVRIGTGAGLVARSPGCILFVPDATAPFAPQLLAAMQEGAARPGRALIREIARLLLEDDTGQAPAFGVVAADGSSLAVMIHGDLTLTITHADGEDEQVSGRGALTWVDRLVEPPFAALALGGLQPATAGGPAFDLKEGVVPGGSVVIWAEAVSPPPPRPAPAGERPMASADTGATAIKVAPAAADDAAAPARPPTVLASAAAAAAPADAEAPVEEPPWPPDTVIVAGVCCRNGHFNRPDVTYCSSCGTSMVHQTYKLVEGPRPPLGVLVLGDGTVFTVDRNLVIGREPVQHPDVVAGTATPVVLNDPDLTVSRVHAELRLVDWDVSVVDCGSSNGTVVIPPGETEGQRLEPNQPVTIGSGTQLQLGAYTLRFDSTYG